MKIKVLQFLLLIVGLVGCGSIAHHLAGEDKLDVSPNVFHLKGSPFGRTLALAMRGPADVYWHRGQVHEHEHDHDHDHDHPDHDHEHDHDHPHHHRHGDDKEWSSELAEKIQVMAQEIEEHEHEHEMEEASDAPAEFTGIRPFLLDTIDGMKEAYYSRTNTNADTKLHQAFILNETQRRLELSYEMDPTNIACYGTYFLFLSEALARVEKEGIDTNQVIHAQQQAALNLCNKTINYCLNYRDEAPAMLTAATAAHDTVQILLSHPEPNLEVAAEYLKILDQTLERFETIRSQMKEEGTWENYSIHRRNEMESAYDLVQTVRKVDHAVLQQLLEAAQISAENAN